ncbi:hypothetical protein PFDG_01972 [Plasmodium falciparum Dd2]|uniref:Plasmodium falciparum erythrocyte membrane protein 1 acidic terminal segment domain-containing protein n=1 Tax=Plasmodium falciparum (isolate Dd2) TaxID=57267 RepID=A0A0L7M6F1_PLAF4|nr:hypothetical protein PFDG_01972 [Plasmodium falciparum Dd2]
MGVIYIRNLNFDQRNCFVSLIYHKTIITCQQPDHQIEREYEDIGINNIYSYKSPKYKTLIEVVLKPSEQTYDMKVTHAYYKDDSNKLTDEEWNQLKHEFIPDYLEDLSSGVDHKSTNENTIDNIYI